MKTWHLILANAVLIPLAAQAQSYTINWYKIAGGGGSASGTNGSTVYTISGTVGQHDASTTMTGGNYSLTGGFWSMIALVQMPGAPILTVNEAGNTVTVSWPFPSTGYSLQTNGDLASPNWGNFTGGISTNDTTINASVTPSVGKLFFRLKK